MVTTWSWHLTETTDWSPGEYRWQVKALPLLRARITMIALIILETCIIFVSFITHTPIFNYSLIISYFQQENTIKATTSFIEEYAWIHTRHHARSPMFDVLFLTGGMNRTNGLRISTILRAPPWPILWLCDWYYELSLTTTSSCSPSFGLYLNLIAGVKKIGEPPCHFLICVQLGMRNIWIF